MAAYSLTQAELRADDFSTDFDEAHALDTLLDARHGQRCGIGLAPLDTRGDLLGEVGVELGEAFDIALGMTGRHARGVGRRGHRSGAAAPEPLRRLADKA